MMLRRSWGFSLVELSVATFIIMFVILAMTASMALILKWHMHAKEEAVAMAMEISLDNLIESMDHVVVIDPSTGDLAYPQDLASDQWAPVVLWSGADDNPKTTIEVTLNGITYTMQAYARMNPDVSEISPGDPPSEIGSHYNDALVVVSFKISWQSEDGSTKSIVYARRFFKRAE